MKTIEVTIKTDKGSINAEGIIEVSSGKLMNMQMMGSANINFQTALTQSKTLEELQKGLSTCIEGNYSIREHPQIKFTIYEK